MAIKYFCDKCKNEVGEYGIRKKYTLTKGNAMLCRSCEQDLELQLKRAEKSWWKGEKVICAPSDEIFNLQYTGFSSHDCESWYKCPECGEQYGSWEFMHKKLQAGEVFKCTKCKANLRVPK